MSREDRRILPLRLGLLDGRPRTLEEAAREAQVPTAEVAALGAKALAALRGVHEANPSACTRKAIYRRTAEGWYEFERLEGECPSWPV